MKNKLKKITKISIILLAILVGSVAFLNNVYASNINAANIYSIGDCGQLLTYKGSIVKCYYVGYLNDGVYYPAYCLDKTKQGAGGDISYGVSVDKAITDVGLWKRIINGYPYKSIEELGVANEYEAFLATKQAIYCYIHGNNPADYGAIGEAGSRTLNAMYKIIENAQNSNENMISSTISINETSKWEQDSKEKTYVSKTYSVTAGANIQNYKIQLYKENGQDIGGIKLTDENNVERDTFEPNEKFKILVPIKNMTEDGEFDLKVEAKINTKPVLYGTAPNSSLQDYALTAATYEDGTGNLKSKYNKNETKIIVIKQDEETNSRLEGVEFELLDENKNVAYSGLKTDKEGKVRIENLVPGRYFLKETATIDGYEVYDEMVVIDIDLNEQVTVTVNNRKEEEPKVEKTTNELTVSNKEVRKLPVTGM